MITEQYKTKISVSQKRVTLKNTHIFYLVMDKYLIQAKKLEMINQMCNQEEMLACLSVLALR